MEEKAVYRFGDHREYKYEPINFFAAEGGGSVYLGKATDSEGHTENVALKVVHVSFGRRQLEGDKMHKMSARCEMLVNLRHENLVTYYQIRLSVNVDVNEVKVNEYITRRIAMNYCPDGDLAQLFYHFQSTRRKMPLKMFLDYAQQMAKGLAFLHAKGIIHANVCPSNLLVSRPKGNINLLRISAIDEPVILQRDLKNSSQAQSGPPHISRAYAILSYMPPEMLVDGNDLCLKSNIWAAGCVIQELTLCCTGEKIKWFRFQDGNEKLDSHEPKPIEYTRKLMEGWVPYIGAPIPNDSAKRIIKGCFATDPDDRFTALELSNKLVEIEEYTYGTTWNPDAVNTDMQYSVEERQAHRLDNEETGVDCQYAYDWKNDIIGQGGFATVYKAKITQWGDFTGNAVVAVKEVILSVDTIRKWKKDGSSGKIKEQWRSLLVLHHDYLVHYYKITVRRLLGGTGVSFMMDYCEGGSLHDMITERRKNNGEFSVESLQRYAVQITTGLQHLHQNGFIHGDLKPSNILLKLQRDGQFNVLIGDFDGSLRLEQGTMAGSRECKVMQWTAPYMSPEMVMMVLGETHQPLTFSSDIWSLGCVLLDLADCCYGIKERYYYKRPISNDPDRLAHSKIRREHYDSFAFLFKLSQGYVPFISELIPQALANIIISCFIADPLDRITTESLLAKI